ncbi:MAG: hypothetical protein IJU72_02315 [Bacteroidales bacterium]|nr:hypothetical protein [Bacteroidales bacterium]
MSIKIKIIMGFIILASLLGISGMISIYEFTKLGNAVTTLLDDNFRSMDYARQMEASLKEHKRNFLEAIERQGAPSFERYDSAKVRFEENLALAANNLTQPDEFAYVDSIAQSYRQLISLSDSLIAYHRFVTLRSYLAQVLPRIEEVEGEIQQLLALNEQKLVQTATMLHGNPLRTILPGLLVIVSSIAFSIIFNYMINHYLLNPVVRITRGIDNYLKYRRPFDVPLEVRDEVFSLREAVRSLIKKVPANPQ